MLRVVLVDDEYFFRNSLKRSLNWEEHGFEVVGDANNGNSGFELIMEQQPDIAIIDINMPVLTGLELIEKLRKHQNHCKCILLTGYDEFKYAQRAISLGVSEYILKPVDFSLLLESLLKLKEQLAKEQKENGYLRELEIQNNRRIKYNFLVDLVNCKFSAHDLEESYLTDLGICIDFARYCAVVFEFSALPYARLEELAGRLGGICREYGAKCFDLFPLNSSRIVLLLSVAEQGDGTGIIRKIAENFAPEQSLCIGVGNFHTQIDEVFLSYNEACLCLKSKMTSSGRMIFYHQINSGTVSLCAVDRMRLSQCIRKQDYDGIEAELTAIYESFRGQSQTYDRIVLVTFELISLLISVLNEIRADHGFVVNTPENILDILAGMPTIDALCNWVQRLFRGQVVRAFDRTANDSEVTQKVEQLIQKNYGDPELSIDLIAKQLFLNYSYVCYCFKRDRGMTINEYITQTRIRQAMQLMEEGRQNISNLSEAVGYSDAGYFSKCFKKATGISPSQFLQGKSNQQND